MPGGFQELVVNPNERALSTDLMRIQRFKGRDVAEIFRALLDTKQGTDDLDASGLSVPTTSQTSPVAAAVVGGLVVSPQVGSLNLLVSAGVAFLYDPDALINTDESQYKLTDDPGVVIAGTLVMASNSSGQTRIDVIECARTNIAGSGADQVLETDNRDVYNTTTGLFSATTVNKVTDGRLQYRVRQGTPGAGFPGTAGGWMPLAVASVPTSTTTNDTITFWDVRPLVADRVVAPFNVTRSFPVRNRVVALASGSVVAGHTILAGFADVTPADTVGGTSALYRLGGELQRGTPGSDTNVSGGPSVDIADAANISGSLAANSLAYVYLLEPFGLPRWARYTDASTGVRKPRSPRGMVVVSSVGPVNPHGCPLSAIALPTSTGLGGTCSRGACIMVLGTDGSALPVTGSADGEMQWTGSAFPITNATIAGSTATWNLVDGTTHPAHAKSVLVDFLIEVVVSGAGVNVVANLNAVLNFGGVATMLAATFNETSGGATYAFVKRVWMPILSPVPDPITPDPYRQYVLNVTSGIVSLAYAQMRVVGYKF